MDDFEGKVALITGGASGIGLGMAKTFITSDMNIMITDIHSAKGIKAWPD